jgi:hypothetical protein
VIVMVLRYGTENPQIAPEIGLLMRRHGAADRWSHLHNRNAPTDFKGPRQPFVLDKTIHPCCSLNHNVGAKAAGINLRI